MEKQYRKNKICRFREKEIIVDKVRDHCHLTGKTRGPTHQKFRNKVTQKQGNFTPFAFHNFSNYDCHLFFKKLIEKKF